MRLFNLELTPANIIFMSNVALHRAHMRLFGITDPSSADYISGDTFRTFAARIFDEREECEASEIQAGDIVFVGLRRLDIFFNTVFPKVRVKFILISHNGDLGISKSYTKYANDHKIIHWFSQNVLFAHPKLTPIPIGLENLDYYNHGITAIFDNLLTHPTTKKSKILYGFSLSTNPKKRGNAKKVLDALSIAQPLPERLNSKQYLEQLVQYQFVASPPGNGEDCIRTWEALYLGVIPIVESSVLTRSFVSRGLPLFLIDSWKELERYNEKELEKLYTQYMKKSRMDALSSGYWKCMVEEKYEI